MRRSRPSPVVPDVGVRRYRTSPVEGRVQRVAQEPEGAREGRACPPCGVAAWLRAGASMSYSSLAPQQISTHNTSNTNINNNTHNTKEP